MPDSLLFRQLHVTFFRPDPLDGPTAARTAIEGPRFLDAVSTAGRQLLDAEPALAALDFVAGG